jgi:thiamine biosynthesis protein ThiS
MTDPMKLTINGEPREFSVNLTVTALLAELALKSDRVAVELNRDLLPRDRWDKTQLNDNDKLEIVHFVGGGARQKLGTSS